MLVKSSGHYDRGLFLLTLGESCHYLLVGIPYESAPNELITPHGLISEQTKVTHTDRARAALTAALRDAPFVLFDPGGTVHAQHLVRRIEQLGLQIKNLQFILLTHLHAERCAGVDWLRSQAPKVRVVGSAAMQQRLLDNDFRAAIYEEDRALAMLLDKTLLEKPHDQSASTPTLRVDEVVADSEVLEVGNTTVRVVSSPGHSTESLAFYLTPQEVVITDECLGYYRGRELPAPGCDHNLALTEESVKRLNTLEIRGIALPYGGILTGQLIRKHFSDLQQILQDVHTQLRKAAEQGIAQTDIRHALREQLFSSPSRDPIFQRALLRSLEALLNS